MRTIAGWLAAIVVVALAITAPALRATAEEPAVAEANMGTVGVISGGVDGTYVRIAAELGSVLDQGDRLRVLTIIGRGSLQNLSDIMYLKGVDVGIVQSDVLTYANRHDLFPGMRQLVQYIAKLYDEEVHILARKDIARVEDLAGKKVNIGVRGSGTAMTASVLFGSLGIPAIPTNDDDEKALDRLERGEIAAVVLVAGQPARLFADAGAKGDGLHFLPVPMLPALADTYRRAQITHAAYPRLVAEGAPVPTIAVGSVMAVYGWPPGSPRYIKVARFVDAFFSKFHEFQRPPRHPKWQQVDLSAEVPGWTRFAAAQQWLTQRQASERVEVLQGAD